MKTTTISVTLLALALGGCGGGAENDPSGSGGTAGAGGSSSTGGGTSTGGAGGSGNAAGSAGAPEWPGLAMPDAPGVQMTTGEIVLEPGQEVTQCFFADLPNTEVMNVVGLEQRNRGYMHHYIVYKRGEPGPGEEFTNGLGECPRGLFTQHPVVYPGTRDQAPFELPDGVALPLEPNQPMVTQLHMLNTTTEPVVAELVVNFHALEGTFERAGIVGGFDTDFVIPPRSEHTETQRCDLFVDANLFGLTSHSHSRTQSFDIATVIDGEVTPVYSSSNWDAPDVVTFDPPIHMPIMRSGFEFSCTWNNDSAETVTYGPDAADEMCIFFGYYFPSEAGQTPCIGF